MNNSENIEAPLRLLRMSRCCTKPTVIHDYLGISRSSILVAAELCITKLLRGPLFKVIFRIIFYNKNFIIVYNFL